ncbi:MAG: CRISPR-associated protein Cas4 [Candidatus Kapaibacterium sp.]
MHDALKYTGTQVNYYFVCQRELWYFSHSIQCEQNSDLVSLGRLIHENSYKEKRKEYLFDSIKIDWLDLENKTIHEVKKSDRAAEPHKWQIKYYLYYFKKMGIEGFKGELNYPKQRKKESIELSADDETKIEEILEDIARIVSLPRPPTVDGIRKYCKNCSYFELCHI